MRKKKMPILEHRHLADLGVINSQHVMMERENQVLMKERLSTLRSEIRVEEGLVG